jgi:hypothetical protein
METVTTVSYEQMLDFAKRLTFKGYAHLTEARRKKLWAEIEPFLQRCVENHGKGWETRDKNGDHPCDLFEDWFKEYDIRWHAARHGKERNNEPHGYCYTAKAICRAACDLLDGQEAIIGWTVGDLRRVFDGSIPEWFSQLYTEPARLGAAKDEALLML